MSFSSENEEKSMYKNHVFVWFSHNSKMKESFDEKSKAGSREL